MAKQTVHGNIVPPSASAQELQATRDTEAEILAVARKQGINMIWERTQQFIAILCVVSSIVMSIYLIITGDNAIPERAYQFLTNAGLLVIGFYFGRTNHARPTGENRDRP